MLNFFQLDLYMNMFPIQNPIDLLFVNTNPAHTAVHCIVSYPAKTVFCSVLITKSCKILIVR